MIAFRIANTSFTLNFPKTTSQTTHPSPTATSLNPVKPRAGGWPCDPTAVPVFVGPLLGPDPADPFAPGGANSAWL